ncbi:MAG: DNA-directed RNA polymerase subunit omega [Thermoanaerobaculia bacterium]
MIELPENVDSKFRYVLVVAKRAEQLIEGSQPKLRTRHAKSTRIAMDEINEGVVNWQPAPPELPEEEAAESELETETV